MLCILYRIHKPRRSAAAELPPHLVRITSVYAEREWSFMKIKLFSCQTPHVRACARARCPGHSGNSCATGLRRTAVCNCKHLHSLSAPRDERTDRSVAEQPLHLPATRRLLYSALRPCNTILLPFLSFLKIFY